MKNIFAKTSTIFFMVAIFFAISGKNVSAETCSGKYGADYNCFNTSAITASKIGECKSDVTCPTSNFKCCPSSAVSFSGGSTSTNTNGTPCSAGYFCKNTVGAQASSLAGCGTNPCKTETYINGRCCPINPVVPQNTTPAQPDSDIAPGIQTDGSGIIQCGRSGQRMCTLCDLIAGLNAIVQYLMKISIFVGLAVFTIAGAMYIISAGNSGTIEMAKSAMKNSAIGFVVIFSAWLIVNYSIGVLGAKDGLGINVTSWGNFVCTDKAAQHNNVQ